MIPKFRFYHLTENEMYEVNSIRLCQKQVECFPKGHKFSFVTYEEDEGIIMQSTGLFDKNGKEIYIGDLILTENGVEEVTFTTQNNCYGVYLQYEKMFNTPIDDYATRISLDHIKGEIIGNKFEHSHLLKED